MRAEADPSESSLKALSGILLNSGYLASYLPMSESNLIEQLIVDTAPPSLAGETDYILQLLFLNDALAGKGGKLGGTPIVLQAYMSLRPDVPEDRLYELAYLCSALSKLLPAGSLHVTREDGLFFRYGLMHPTRNINTLLLIELIEQIGLFMRELGPKLEDFLRKGQSVDEVLRAVEQRFSDMAQA